MRPAPLAALGILAYIAFLAATIPATFVAARVQASVPDRVRVHEASGTLWHGAARVDIAAGGTWIALDNLAWRLRPAELLTGRLAFAIDAQASGAAAQGTLARSLSKWHASGQASAPAAFAATLLPLLGTWRPEGRIEARASDFAWDDREARGEAIAEWRDAAVALAQVRPLGSYRATLRAEGPGGKIDIATIDGPLRVSGHGEVAFPSRFTFDGEARAQGPQSAALDPLLDLLGPRRPDGARTLAWRSH